MNNNKNNSVNISKSIVISGIKAALISFVIMLVMFLFSSAFCIKSDNVKLNLSIVSYSLFALASFLGGSITAFGKCDKKIFAAFTSVFTMLVLTFVLLAFVSHFSLEIKSLILIPVCLVCSVLGCMLFKNRKKRH